MEAIGRGFRRPLAVLRTFRPASCPLWTLKRIGEDVAEKLDYTPGVFTVERHIRGKWACAQCQTLVQAPVPAQVIDKGIPTRAYWPRCWWPNTPTTCRGGAVH
jgi:transposase